MYKKKHYTCTCTTDLFDHASVWKMTYLLLDHAYELRGASATVRSVGRGHTDIVHDHYHILIPTSVIVPVAKKQEMR